MERGGSVRVNAGDALAGLGRIADNLAGQAMTPNIPQDLGQGRARGMVNLGQGVKDLGQARMDIEARRAEARNYVELSKASLEMEREMGEFQKFQETNPDPSTWKAEWDRRASEWPGRYLEGRDYPQALQDSIRARVLARGEQFGIDVDVAATKATVAMARESLMAEVELAEADGRMDEASALLKTGVDRGWVRADVAAQREVQAREKIENQTISEALQYADAFATRGDMPSSFAALDSIRGMMPEGEYQAKRAKLETQVSVAVASNEIMDRMANGEDPDALRAELEARNEDGSFVAYPELRPAVRADILAPIYQASNDEYSALVSDAGKGIDSGIIKDEIGLNEYFQGKEIDPLTRSILVKKLRGEVVKTEETVISMQLEAAKYDPASDPDGRVYAATLNRVYLALEDDPRAESIVATLDKRRRGEALTIGEEMKARKLAEVKTYVEAKGDWRITSDRIRPVEKNGERLYIDTGADVQPGDDGYFETGQGWFDGAHVKGRILQLSQDDRIAIDQGKEVTVDDLGQKNRALAEGARMADEIEQDMESGKIQDGAQADEKFNGLVAPMRKDAAAATIEGGLFPPALRPASNMTNPQELRSWILSGEVTF
jgi:hypothetical protein